MIGPSKYDDLVTQVRYAAQAEVVMLVVLGGKRGSGFGVQATRWDAMKELPRVLREVADQIEKDEGRL